MKLKKLVEKLKEKNKVIKRILPINSEYIVELKEEK